MADDGTQPVERDAPPRARAWTVRHHRGVLIGTLVLVAVAAVVGGKVEESLTVGGLADTDSEYERGRVMLEELGQGPPNFVLLLTAKATPDVPLGETATAIALVDEQGYVDAGLALTEELRAQEGVLEAASYWSFGKITPLRSTDGTQALVFAALGGTEDEVRETASRLSPLFSRETDLYEVHVGGAAEVSRQVSAQAESDLKKAELIVAPITFIALYFVFGGVLAALLPLGVALVSVLMTFASLRLLTLFTDVSIFSLNLTTALGLGLAIDYSLFVLSRYREERHAGLGLDLALRRAMRTAGRTVVFSAVTVAVSLAALLVFPMVYLRSFAYAGIVVVTMAALSTLVVLPALLTLLGDRAVRGQRPRRDGLGFWGHQARRVMRRPLLVTVLVTALLLVLALPFRHLTFGFIDDRVIPATLSSRATNDEIRATFSSLETDAIGVVIPGLPGDQESSYPELREIALRIAQMDFVGRVDGAYGHLVSTLETGPDATTERFETPGSTWLSVVPGKIAVSPETEGILREIRSTDFGRPVLVTGATARYVDAKDAVNDRMVFVFLFIVLVTFVVLFALLGSVVVPLKAVVMNVLSLTATFGALVWIFQDGHFASLLDVTPTGTIDVFTPMLMFCVAFGLSMDYEVFVLSRIKEEYDLSGDNTHAIEAGLDKTGRLVTAAASLLALVFLAFMTSAVTTVKMIGLGLMLAVLVDAFLIRATLVPAFMRLTGRANWWAPRTLRTLHLRYGIWEKEPSIEMDRLQHPSCDTPEVTTR